MSEIQVLENRAQSVPLRDENKTGIAAYCRVSTSGGTGGLMKRSASTTGASSPPTRSWSWRMYTATMVSRG